MNRMQNMVNSCVHLKWTGMKALTKHTSIYNQEVLHVGTSFIRTLSSCWGKDFIVVLHLAMHYVPGCATGYEEPCPSKGMKKSTFALGSTLLKVLLKT